MHTYIAFFKLLTFYSVAVSSVLGELLKVAKYIFDIHQKNSKSYVFVMIRKEKSKVRIILIFFSARITSPSLFLGGGGNMCSDFESSDAKSLLGNVFLIWINHGKYNYP
jgi:hypothetical protein